MSLEFDIRGNLFPYEKITIPPEILEREFVNNFPNSDSRKVIYINFEKLKNEITGLLESDLKVWVNGSFISK